MPGSRMLQPLIEGACLVAAPAGERHRGVRARLWVAASSDAIDGHPRRFGSFAERWRKFVRSRPLMTPAEFVHRSSGLTAAIFALEGRGTLRVGGFVDIAVLDPDGYASKAGVSWRRAATSCPEIPAFAGMTD